MPFLCCVLQAIDCCTPRYTAFKWFAMLLVLLVPIGIPAVLAYVLFHAQKTAQLELSRSERGELDAIDRMIGGANADAQSPGASGRSSAPSCRGRMAARRGRR